MGEMPLEIDSVELDRLRRTAMPPAILAVREPWETSLCRFDGSIDIPLRTLPFHLETLPRNRTLVVVCYHGIRGLRAVAWLRANGFANAASLRGGIDAWAREIAPAMRTY